MQDVNDTTFAAEVLEVDGVTLVDFWADWCRPCKELTPILEKLDTDEIARVVKVNVNDNPGLVREYKTMSIPTVLAFKNGELVDKFVGLQSEETIRTFVSNL